MAEGPLGGRGMAALAGKMSETNGAALVQQPAPGHLEVTQMPSQAYKRCTACGQTKPLEDFNRNRCNPDGKQARCKVCHRRASASWRKANPEKVREQTQARDRRAGKRREASRHPRKYRARRMLSKALQRGTITKPNCCERCSAELEAREIHGHHHDYSKPLEVEWLCRSCHVEEHRKDHQR